MRRSEILNDAGFLREHLAEELALWQVSGWFHPERAWRFYRLVRRLARMIGQSEEWVMSQTREDAEYLREVGE